MELRQIIASKPWWTRPLQFEGTAMHPNVLIMCKLLVLLIVAHHFIRDINDPFIPFISGLDIFREYPGVFKIALQSIFCVSALALVLNYYVRTASLILGIIVIFTLLSSKPLFANHTFICGCALFLAGLTNNKQSPWLLFLQLSIVYFGACINKITDIDWWSGAYMHNWLLNARENPFYISVSQLMPDLWFAKFLSWIAMASELIIGTLLLSKKYRALAVWIIIIFHGMLFTITSFRFGHFFESLLILLIAFIVWPKGRLTIAYKPTTLKWFKQIISFLDFDQKQQWTPIKDKTFWLRLSTETKTMYNDVALKHIILYTPAFYIFLFAADSMIYFLLSNHQTLLFILNVICLWILALFFLPISWSKYVIKKN